MKPFKQLLIELNACEGAQEWAAEKSIEEAVSTCQRGDWMLWLAKKVNVGIRPLTHAKGKCANTVRHLMKDERSINAVDAAIDFGNGVINEDELAAYAAAAADADAADADAAAAASSRKENQLLTADICREIIGAEIVTKVNELLNR